MSSRCTTWSSLTLHSSHGRVARLSSLRRCRLSKDIEALTEAPLACAAGLGCVARERSLSDGCANGRYVARWRKAGCCMCAAVSGPLRPKKADSCRCC
eukprot:549742-Prymnesium_polylepis.1